MKGLTSSFSIGVCKVSFGCLYICDSMSNRDFWTCGPIISTEVQLIVVIIMRPIRDLKSPAFHHALRAAWKQWDHPSFSNWESGVELNGEMGASQWLLSGHRQRGEQSPTVLLSGLMIIQAPIVMEWPLLVLMLSPQYIIFDFENNFFQISFLSNNLQDFSLSLKMT